MARKIQNIAGANKEILVLTSPSFVKTWDEAQISALIEASEAGITVKIYLTYNSILPLFRLNRAKAAGIEVRAGSRRWLGADSDTDEEIWIFDREGALSQTRAECKELKTQPVSGRLSVECALARAPAKTAARYFDHRWEGHPEGVALVVRHKEYSFRGGKGAEKDFLVYAARARKEISVCLIDARISTTLNRALHAAIKRHVKVKIYANSYGLTNLRNRFLLGRLLRAGADLRFTAGHMPLDSVCATIDGHSTYLGALPGSVRGWRRVPRPVFFLHDKELATALCAKLDRQVGNRISSENSKGLLTSSPSF